MPSPQEPPRVVITPRGDAHVAASPRHAADAGTIAPWTLYAAFFAFLGFGLFLFFFGAALTDLLADLLPDAATVRSNGTQYPAFSEAGGWGRQLRALGLVLLVAAVAGLVFVQRSIRTRIAQAVNRLTSHQLAWFLLLLVVAFALYAYLAYPPYAWPSNARMHWVDQFYDRGDNFFYTLLKLPHLVFYDIPHVWQGLNGALSVALTYAIGRRLFRPRWAAFALALGFLASSNMLFFANMAEDVSINVTAVLLAIYAFTRRHPVGLGIAFFIVFLGRPQLALLVVAFALTHAAYWVWERRRSADGPTILQGLTDRFFLYNILTFTALFAVWTVVLTVLDARYFLTGSELLEQTSLFEQEPRPVEGFLLHPFSGAYLYHLLWVFPLPVLLANAYVAVRFKRLSRDAQQLALFCWLWLGISLLFLEFAATSYYNVRYITYYWPLIMVPAAFAPGLVNLKRFSHRTFAAAAGSCVLLLAVAAPYTPAFTLKSQIEQRPLTSLYPDRHKIRELAEDRGGKVYTAYTSHTEKNYLAYILKEPFSSVKDAESGSRLPEGALLVRPAEGGRGVAEVVYRNEKVEVVRRPEQGGPEQD